MAVEPMFSYFGGRLVALARVRGNPPTQPLLTVCGLCPVSQQGSGVSQQGRQSVCFPGAGRGSISFMLRAKSISKVKREVHKIFPESQYGL